MLVVAAVVLLYAPCLGHGFVFDDLALLDEGGRPRPLGNGALLPYRPLRYASHLVDAALGGAPAVHHAHNIALHAAAALLVARIARGLGAERLAAGAAALLFAAHPLAVEAVAYVSGRRDVLATVLGLGAVALAMAGRFGAAAAMVAAGGLAKESALVFALPATALAVVSVRGLRDTAASRWRALLGIPAAAAVSLGAAVAFGAVGPFAPPAGLDGAALVGRSAVHYLGGLLLAWPPMPEYPWLLTAAPARDAAACVPLLAALVGAGAMLVARGRDARGSRDAGSTVAAWWCASAFAALAAGGALHEPGADRHAMVLLPALAVAVALGATRMRERGGAAARIAVPAVLALAVVALAVPARRSMAMWRDERTLWAAAAARPDATPRALANHARALAADGHLGHALRDIRRALARDRDDASLRLVSAAIRCDAGRRGAAHLDLGEAVRLGAAPALVDEVTRACRGAASDGEDIGSGQAPVGARSGPGTRPGAFPAPAGAPLVAAGRAGRRAPLAHDRSGT